jgi:hypothetical protein
MGACPIRIHPMPGASSPSMTSNKPVPMAENGLVESSPQEMPGFRVGRGNVIVAFEDEV